MSEDRDRGYDHKYMEELDDKVVNSVRASLASITADAML